MTIKLNGKTYTQDYVRARALREIGPAKDWIKKMEEAEKEGRELTGTEWQEATKTLIRWFCLFFGGQFTEDEVLDGYPSDNLIHDIVVAAMATIMQTTRALQDFPLTAARQTGTKVEP